MLDLEQLEFTEKVVHEVSRLKNLLSQKVQALSASGRMTMHDVEKLKNDKWTNEYLNIHVLHDQLIRKLHAHRLELNVLDHSKAHTLDQNIKAHVEKAVKS